MEGKLRWGPGPKNARVGRRPCDGRSALRSLENPPGTTPGRMDSPAVVRSRLRFDRLDHTTTPDGSGRVSVRLEWGGQIYEGTVSCLDTQQGIIKAASQATLRA